MAACRLVLCAAALATLLTAALAATHDQALIGMADEGFLLEDGVIAGR